MANLWGITDSDLRVAIGAILALGAMLTGWWTHRETLWRLMLATACAFGLVALIYVGMYSNHRPFNTPTMALAAVGIATGLWGLVHGPLNRLSKVLLALAVALGLGAFLLGPIVTWPGAHRRGLFFGLAEIAYILASAALWHGVISSVAFRHNRLGATTRSASGAALLLLTVSLLLYGIGAQWAWGAYWSWEPFACWWLATWLAVAIATSGSQHLGWASRCAVFALWLAAGFALLVLLGSLSLVQWLGLNGQY